MKAPIMVKVTDLRPHSSYAKIYSTTNAQFVLLVDSIRATGGLLEPIVINKKNQILSGVQRWRAYKELDKDVIPAIVIDKPEADEVFYIISYNRYREKSIQEKYLEIDMMKRYWGKKQGERTDLKTGLSEEEKLSTRARIAQTMNISEGNVFKIEKIAQHNKDLFVLIDSRELSLNEAYQRVPKTKKVKAKKKNDSTTSSNGEIPEEIISCQCPKCGHEFKN
ncbi:MAG: ParB/RepB/Spo0J family partition protein [Bacteroidia bacterium]